MSDSPKQVTTGGDWRSDLRPNSCAPQSKSSVKLNPEDIFSLTHPSLDADPKLLLRELNYLVKKVSLNDPAVRRRIEKLLQAIPGDVEDNWRKYALKTEYSLKIGNPRQYTESKFYLQWLVDHGNFDSNGQKALVTNEIKRLESEFNKSRTNVEINLALVLSEKDQDGNKSGAPLRAAVACGAAGGVIGGAVGMIGGPLFKLTVPGGAFLGASYSAGICATVAEIYARIDNYMRKFKLAQQYRENGATPWSTNEVVENGAAGAISIFGALQSSRSLFSVVKSLFNAKGFAYIGYASGYGGRPNGEIGELVAGSQGAPDKLRELGGLNALGNRAVDLGNATSSGFMGRINLNEYEKTSKNAEQVLRASYALKDKVLDALRRGLKPVVVGGDHTQSIGTDAALAEHYGRSIGHVHIDTHADFNTIRSSWSKNMHGMPLAFLTGADKELKAFSGIQRVFPAVRSENLVLIALRDIDTKELELLKANKITFFTAEDVSRLGLNEVLKQAKAIAGNGTPGYNVSFDIDVVEGSFVPGTGTSVGFIPGEFATGMLPHNARYAVASLLQDGKALAAEVTELNPNLDRNNRTVDFALSILHTIGKHWK